ncbi:hypothetical protein BDR04DRAFT_1121651 [Suillus decipiens]|nr:hypothetical protein BDR04DRAFT_1121651 [Suillus decipiens]
MSSPVLPQHPDDTMTEPAKTHQWQGSGEQIMTCSADGSLRAWNLKTGKRIGDDWGDGDNVVWTISLSLDRKKMRGRIAYTRDIKSTIRIPTARLWNLRRQQLAHQFVPPICTFHGKLLATGWYNNNAYAWGVSAMVKEAGLDDLLLDQRDKFLLASVSKSSSSNTRFLHDTASILDYGHSILFVKPGGEDIELRRNIGTHQHEKGRWQ